LKEQLRLLEDLQRHDARLQEYEQSLKALPEKLASLKADLAKVEALLVKERQDLADTEKFKADQVSNLRADEASMAKSKVKLAGVKTGKEHMAAQREIEANKKSSAEREAEIARIGEAIETQRKKVETHQADLDQLREAVAREEAATNARIDEIKAKIAHDKVARDEAAARIEGPLMKRYSSIRMRRGLAVVPVVAGTCKGCHMAIPPQLFIQLQRAKTIETCPTCNRLIYWDQLLKEAQLEQGEKGSE
jgi:predicted  nucleic acid-binding Zn-ribbon protein